MTRQPVQLGSSDLFRAHPLQLDGRAVDPDGGLPAQVGRPAPGGASKRVYFEQYGCAVTQGEASVMRAVLREQGHEVVASLDDADTAVLVTCTVVDTTERRMVDRIKALDDAGVDLVVSGCMASSQVDLIKHTAPTALILPPQYHHQVGELIAQESVEFCYAPKSGLPRELDGVVATVVINEGCSGKCTFCITKIARPGLRSYPVSGIVDDVRAAVARGAREVRLTSQDSGAYGLDRGTDLPTLLRHVCEVPGDYRVRVGMMNPFILDPVLPGLLDAFAHERMYKFLHIPVQSGSEPVLEAMRRAHAVDDFERQVAAFRERFPHGVVSTDVITGFPTETAGDHRATVALLERVRPDVVNITRYSPRAGTPAAEMEQIPGGEVKERSRELTDIALRLSEENNARIVGEEFSALVVEPGKPGTDTVKARTDEYRQVVLPADGLALGDRVRCRVTEARVGYVMGEVA